MSQTSSKIAPYGVGAAVVVAIVLAPFAMKSLWLIVFALAVVVAFITVRPRSGAGGGAALGSRVGAEGFEPPTAGV